MGAITIGIAKIEMSDLGAGGIPGTDFSELGYSVEDSFQFNEADGNQLSIRVDQKRQPLFSRTDAGDFTFSFQMADPDLDAFAALKGGTNASGTYSSGDTVTVEKTVKITPDVGYIFTFNRVSVKATFNGNYGRNNAAYLTVTGTILEPEDGTSKAYTITDPDFVG